MTPHAVVRTILAPRPAVYAVGAAALLLDAWACRRAAPAPAPPPPAVSVLTRAPGTGSPRFEFVGQAAAPRRVGGRAQGARVLVRRPPPPGTGAPQAAPPL